MNRSFRVISENDFLDVYKLMQVSFPPSEFRTYEEQLALFKRPNYKVYVFEENNVMLAFVAEWILTGIHFIEHFAVNPELRGHGIGSEITSEYLKQISTSVVIEVEAADTSIAKRRIAFYERSGFALSNIEYIQPLLRKTSTDVLLRLMHFPAEISEETLYEAKREIFQAVYI